MWHSVISVAESQHIDAEALASFAIANENKYGVVVEHGHAKINTWYVNDLVRDFIGLHKGVTTSQNDKRNT